MDARICDAEDCPPLAVYVGEVADPACPWLVVELTECMEYGSDRGECGVGCCSGGCCCDPAGGQPLDAFSPVGEEGAFFVHAEDFSVQDDAEDGFSFLDEEVDACLFVDGDCPGLDCGELLEECGEFLEGQVVDLVELFCEESVELSGQAERVGMDEWSVDGEALDCTLFPAEGIAQCTDAEYSEAYDEQDGEECGGRRDAS